MSINISSLSVIERLALVEVLKVSNSTYLTHGYFSWEQFCIVLWLLH